eukprot:15443563-Alexandrium_andersonii.AAC.1
MHDNTLQYGALTLLTRAASCASSPQGWGQPGGRERAADASSVVRSGLLQWGGSKWAGRTALAGRN